MSKNWTQYLGWGVFCFFFGGGVGGFRIQKLNCHLSRGKTQDILNSKCKINITVFAKLIFFLIVLYVISELQK